MSDIEVRSQREETRGDNSSNNKAIVPSNRDVQTPVSCTRTHNPEMIPQLNGPMSVCSRRRMLENERMEQEYLGELL